jgi:hypothetical protein
MSTSTSPVLHERHKGRLRRPVSKGLALPSLRSESLNSTC